MSDEVADVSEIAFRILRSYSRFAGQVDAAIYNVVMAQELVDDVVAARREISKYLKELSAIECADV